MKRKKTLEHQIFDICESLYKIGVNDGKGDIHYYPNPARFKKKEIMKLIDQALQAQRDEFMEAIEQRKWRYIIAPNTTPSKKYVQALDYALSILGKKKK